MYYSASMYAAYFGYPTCCNTMRHPPPGHWSIGTGYVPCADCAMLPKEEVVAGINKRRWHAIPFPDHSGSMVTLRALDKLLYRAAYGKKEEEDRGTTNE